MKIFIIIFLVCIFNTGLYAQSTAVEIENLLASNAVTYAQASRFILDAAGEMITNNPDEAFQYAAEKKWLPGRASAGAAARLDDVCLLLLKAFNIKGGLFYTLTGNSHYAYREVEYRNLIQEKSDPAMKVSGNLLLFMVGRILSESDIIIHEDVLALDKAREEAARNEALAAETALREEEIRRREAIDAARREAEIAALEEAARQEALAAEIALREEEIRRQEALAAQIAAAREAEIAAMNEAARREAELEAARREAEIAAMNEAARREAELEAARREAELAAMNEAARREAELEAARREAELAAMDEAARREAELEAARRQAELAAMNEAARREAELEAARRQAELAAMDEAARREAELEAARREAELAAMNEAARREAELDAARREAELEAARRQAEVAAMNEAARREAEAVAMDEAARRQAELAAMNEAARREAELEAARREAEAVAMNEAARREAELAAQAVTVAINFPLIQFLPDDIELLDSEKKKLQEIAALLKNIPGVKLKIDGHAAFAGTRAGRIMISEGRARNVADYLISLGAVVPANVITEGHGAEFPAASNLTPQGMAANRRAVITILER